jgi:hypothetical protein
VLLIQFVAGGDLSAPSAAGQFCIHVTPEQA